MAKKQFERREEMPGQNPGKTQDPNRRNPETGSRRSDTETGKEQKISNDNLEQEGNTDDLNRRSSEEPVEDNSTRS